MSTANGSPSPLSAMSAVSSITTGTNMTQARGVGRGGRHGGRGLGRGGRGFGRGGRNPNTPAFKGNTAKMNGRVFQCFNESLDKKQFTKTLEALGEYVAKHMKYPGDLASLVKELKKPTLTSPSELSDEDAKSILKKTVWEKKVASYCMRLDYLDSNLKATYAIIWSQCSKAMKAKLMTLEDYKKKNSANNCVWLLKAIKAITYRFEGQRYLRLSLALAYGAYYAYRQGPEDSLSEHIQQFRSTVEVLEHYGGVFGAEPSLLEEIKKMDTPPSSNAGILLASRNCTLALAFL